MPLELDEHDRAALVSCLANFGQSSCLIGTGELSLESGWSEVVQGGMPAVVVVVGEVAGNVLPSQTAVLVFGHFEFGLANLIRRAPKQDSMKALS
jgi:hypothetical protein